MAGIFKHCTRSNIVIFKRLFAKQVTRNAQWKNGNKVRLTDRFKTVNVHLGRKGWTFISVGTLIAVEIGLGIGELMSSAVGSMTACVNFLGYIENLEEEGGNKFTEYLTYIRRKRKEKKRKEMIGTGVGSGLAWYYYVTFLQYMFSANIEDKVTESRLLTDTERKRMPMKIYALLPRKCFLDILETDDNIELVGRVTIDAEKKLCLDLISIMDGQTKYFCLIDCPSVLKTMTEVNDIQMAGISRSKYSSFVLPWNKNAEVQLFTIDTKLVQLMRFYYTLNSILCMKDDFTKKTSLVLYNESDKKPSEVLLQAIKTDLNVSKAEKVKQCSLMERKLLSAEEKKDIDYPFHVFVSHRIELNDQEKTEEEYNDDLKNEICERFEENHLKVLSEKECVGKDWLTKLKYAATKCRWMVFLDTKNSKSELFISHKVTESINSILESKKVQTVAIVNAEGNMHILDDLRWVTCIPYEENKIPDVINTLLKVVKGSDKCIGNAKGLYLQPGEVAVGLAWHYASHKLNQIIPTISKTVKESPTDLPYPLKLFIYLQENCKQHNVSKADHSTTEGVESPNFEEGKPQVFTITSKTWNKLETKSTLKAICVGEYPKATQVLRQMNVDGILDEKQVNVEMKTFHKTVDKIMQILLPDQTENYEFVYINDNASDTVNGIMNIYRKDEFADIQERKLFAFSQF